MTGASKRASEKGLSPQVPLHPIHQLVEQAHLCLPHISRLRNPFSLASSSLSPFACVSQEEALVQTNGLRWRSGNVARVALLVTDAPPRSSNLQAALEASLGLRQNGVRLYGLAAGGASPKAEYVLRLVSLLTGARYAWLTGNGNNNPWHTWLTGTEQGNNPYGCHEITALDRLLVRVLAAELLGKRIEEGGGQQDGGVCSWLGGVCSWLGTASSTHPNCSTSEEEGNSGTDVGPTTTVPGGE